MPLRRLAFLLLLLTLALPTLTLPGCSGDAPVGPDPIEDDGRDDTSGDDTSGDGQGGTSDVIAFLLISGDHKVLPADATEVTFTASAWNANSQQINRSVDYTWASSDSTVFIVDDQGVVTTVEAGAAILSVHAEEVAATVEVDVLPTTGDGVAAVDLPVVDFMAEWEVPGGAYAVVKDGRLVLARGYGYADVSAREPVVPDHLFRIASLSKAITGVATLNLVSNAQLGLDDRIYDILSDLVPTAGPADPRMLDMTVSQALHHTSGWDVYGATDPMFSPRDIAAAMGVPSPPDASTILRYMGTQPLGFRPGAQFVYTNISYTALGRVIERISGLDYEHYVQQEVFAPMGITRPRIGRSLKDQRADGEVVYYSDEWGLRRSVFDDAPGTVEISYGGFHLEAMDAHGGWIASAVDLARFAVAVDGDDTTPEFLRPDWQRYMVQNTGSPFGAGSWYGTGWFVNPQGNGELQWTHTGALTGAVSYISTWSDGLTIVALLNTRRGISDPNNTFFNDFITSFATAARGVGVWPDQDLFSDYR